MLSDGVCSRQSSAVSGPICAVEEDNNEESHSAMPPYQGNDDEGRESVK